MTKKLFAYAFLYLFTVLSVYVFGQSSDSKVRPTSTATMEIVNYSFPGGDEKFNRFLHFNLDKKKLNSSGKKGRLVAQFTINPTGLVSDIQIIAALDTIAENEFIRVLRLLPKFDTHKLSGQQLTPQKMNMQIKIPYDN